MTELRQEPHLIVIYITDLTKLRRRRQRERQKSTKFYEQNNNPAVHHALLYISLPSLYN